jgi:RNA-binding protein
MDKTQLRPTMPLTSKQRAHLRRLGNRIKPVVHVGADGVTQAVLDSILDALNTRELLKVKLQESAQTKARDAADRIVAALDDVHAVQTIGRTVILYRAHPEQPEIRLPKSGT